MNQTQISWPPDYKIKKHRLAKHVKLRIGMNGDLVITVPPRFSLKHISGILEEHKHWIVRELANYSVQERDVLPTQIELHAIRQAWTVSYLPCQKRLNLYERPG